MLSHIAALNKISKKTNADDAYILGTGHIYHTTYKKQCNSLSLTHTHTHIHTHTHTHTHLLYYYTMGHDH